MSGRFWEDRPIEALDRAQWEALCDGCGKCCLHQLEDEDTGDLYPTNVACRLLDRKSGRCSDYRHRHAHVPECIRLTPAKLATMDWLPESCAYVRRANGLPLPEWHYLVSGDREAIHRAGASVRGWTISEVDAGDLENHILEADGTPVFEGGGHRRELTIVRMASARTMRLAIDPRRGAVRLTLPRRANVSEALRWAESKRGWIEDQLSKIPLGEPLAPGVAVPYRGHDHRIDWSPAHPRRPAIIGGELRIGGPQTAIEARLLRWLREEARQLLTAETRDYAARAGVGIGRVSLGDPVSRWGSCSASGDIRYSWRLILAPDFVRRATVAHEVAHLVHMDHSPAFHALVAKLFEEDPKPARAWLRKEGPGLHRFGR